METNSKGTQSIPYSCKLFLRESPIFVDNLRLVCSRCETYTGCGLHLAELLNMNGIWWEWYSSDTAQHSVVSLAPCLKFRHCIAQLWPHYLFSVKYIPFLYELLCVLRNQGKKGELWILVSYSVFFIPYHTTPYHTIPHHTIPYHTIPYHTTPYHIIPHHTTPYHTIPYHTIPYPSTAFDIGGPY